MREEGSKVEQEGEERRESRGGGRGECGGEKGRDRMSRDWRKEEEVGEEELKHR